VERIPTFYIFVIGFSSTDFIREIETPGGDAPIARGWNKKAGLDPPGLTPQFQRGNEIN
jgi:hypothetical protein